MRRPAPEHVLATVMFIDMVGSSEVATEMGDRRWRVLLGRYHRLLRSEISRFGGRELDSAGDGVFAMFSDQEFAVRCACAVSEGVQHLGVDVRAGVHAGRAERVGKKIGGIAVHTGARVMAAAGAGDVLVSGVVKDLVSGSGLEFEDRGVHHLKGIPDDVHLYAAKAVDGASRPAPLSAEEGQCRRAEVQPPPLLLQRPVRRVLAGVILAAVVAAFAAAAILTRSSHAVVIHSNSILRIDARTGKIVEDIPVDDPAGTQLVAVPPHGIATLSQAQGVVSVIDATTNRRVRMIGGFFEPGSPAANSSGLGYADGYLWVADTKRTVTRLLLTGGISGVYHLTGNPTMVTTVGGQPWVFAWEGQIYRFDPETGQFVQTSQMLIPGGPTGVVTGEGSVWVMDSGTYHVSRISPDSGRPESRTPVGVGATAIAAGDGFIWTNNLGSLTSQQTVSKVDPSTLRVRSFPIGKPSQENFTGIAVADHSVWVSSPFTHRVIRLSEDGHVIDALPVHYVPQGMIAAYGSVWVAISRY